MEEGDRYTLGLLLELRALAKEASETTDWPRIPFS